MTKNYIAITIGPIVKTLMKAKKTRELWAASYIFSFMMKQLVLLIEGKNGELPDEIQRKFLIPFLNDKSIFESHYGAGLFPDRLIFEAKEGDFDRLPQLIKSVNALVSETISGKTGGSVSDIENYVSQYFKIYAIQKQLDENINPIIEFSKDLSVIELQNSFVTKEVSDYLKSFFDRVNGSLLFKDGFKNQAEIKGFPTLIEISLAEFFGKMDLVRKIKAETIIKRALDAEKRDNKKKINEEDAIYKSLKNEEPFKGNLYNYHKYVAIIQADGDSFGKTIQQIFEKDKADGIVDFHKRMLEFNFAAIDKIVEYGGKPIYLGGDDLLFFAPVAIANQSVFDLISELDKVFAKAMTGLPKIPTLSYGISITYHKFPMYEALKEAYRLLDEKAKKDFGDAKNAVSFNLMKHSRTGYVASFNKAKDKNGNNLYTKFTDLITAFRRNDKLFSSLVFTLRKQKDILDLIGSDEIKMENYFDNTFNETIHDTHRKDINSLRDFVHNIYASGLYDKAMETALSALRFIKFLTEKDNEND